LLLLFLRGIFHQLCCRQAGQALSSDADSEPTFFEQLVATVITLLPLS
jgi:hypothetical protein